jgi:feruloyl-CoA synthase
MTDPKYRPLTFGVTRVDLRDGPPACTTCVPSKELQDLSRAPDRPAAALGCRAPERTFMARRVQSSPVVAQATGECELRTGLGHARNIAQALINRGLNAERPVVILSENDLEHALLSPGLHGGWCAVRAHFAALFPDQPGLRQARHVLAP